jgi:hypothetical protein
MRGWACGDYLMTDQENPTFEKDAPIIKADSDRQVVVGAVMEPNAVDLAGDFERPETIRRLSEGYMERLATGESQSGVMHAMFPDDGISHVENRVLETTQKIGGEEYSPGTWVVGKKVNDDELWNLVESGSIGGFSIGGYIHDAERYASDDVPADVHTGDYDGADLREVKSATIREISLVDTPAVPRATIQVAKSADDSDETMLKADPRLTAGTDEATEYLVEERNHDPDDAKQLAQYLNGETKAVPDESNGGPSWFAKAKAFFGGSDGDGDDDEDTEKVGATLSQSNRDSLMEIHDSALSVLQDAGYGPTKSTFASDPRVDFDFDGEKAQGDDELAESSGESESVEDMDTNELKSLIGEVIDEKMGDEGPTEEKAEEEPSDLEEIKSMVADLKESAEDEQTEKEAEDDDDLEEIKAMLKQMANAQGVSQQKSRASDDEADGGPMDKIAEALG